MCSWGWEVFSESITNHWQTLNVFGRSEAIPTMLIFHRQQYHLPSSCISNFTLSLSVWRLAMWIPDELVPAFKICIIWGEGAVTANWHRNGSGRQAELEALIPMNPPYFLSAGLSPKRPYFKVISQVLVHWLFLASVKEAEEERLSPCGRSRSWELEWFCDLALTQSRLTAGLGYKPTSLCTVFGETKAWGNVP